MTSPIPLKSLMYRTLKDRALRLTCPDCRCGAGERCFDMRRGYEGLRCMSIHPGRMEKARNQRAREQG